MTIATALTTLQNRVNSIYTELGNKHIDMGTASNKNLSNAINIIKNIRNIYSDSSGILYRQYDKFYVNADVNFYIPYLINVNSEFRATVQCTAASTLSSLWTQNNNISYYWYSGSANNRFGTLAIAMTNRDGNKINIVQNKDGIWQDNFPNWQTTKKGSYSGTPSFDSSNPNVTLFGDGSRRIKGYIWNIKILESGSTKFNLIPVLRLSDSKPGLFDIVSSVFYTPNGNNPTLSNG